MSRSEEWEPIAENEPTSLVGEWHGGGNRLRIRLGPGGLEISAGGANDEVMRLMEVAQSSGGAGDSATAQSQRWIATDANSVPVYQVELLKWSSCLRWGQRTLSLASVTGRGSSSNRTAEDLVRQRLLIRHVDDGDELEFFRIGEGPDGSDFPDDETPVRKRDAKLSPDGNELTFGSAVADGDGSTGALAPDGVEDPLGTTAQGGN